MKIGAHVSSAGSLSNSFLNAQRIGASCTQIFITPPQQWFAKKYQEQDIKNYQQAQKSSGIGPNFIHGIYLINLATDNLVSLAKAIEWLSYSLNTASSLGIKGTIFHLGSGKDKSFADCLPQVTHAIKTILQKSEGADLILENCAGAGNLIGDSLWQLAQIIEQVKNPRLKVCLDTQHLFASGLDIRETDQVDQLLAEFNSSIGLENLVAIHINDSKVEFASKRDRHENIGEGKIGLSAFGYILNHPKLANLPFILEVPGFAGQGPDQENINILKSLIK